MRTWQLQEAKARLSEVIKEASLTPQVITLHGKPAVIVLSNEEYEKLSMPKPSFIEFMRQSPLAHVTLNLKRNRSLTRKIKL